MLEGGAVLAKFPFPTLDAAFVASLMRGAMAMLMLAALVWLASGFVRRFMQGKDEFAHKVFAMASGGSGGERGSSDSLARNKLARIVPKTQSHQGITVPPTRVAKVSCPVGRPKPGGELRTGKITGNFYNLRLLWKTITSSPG